MLIWHEVKIFSLRVKQTPPTIMIMDICLCLHQALLKLKNVKGNMYNKTLLCSILLSSSVKATLLLVLQGSCYWQQKSKRDRMLYVIHSETHEMSHILLDILQRRPNVKRLASGKTSICSNIKASYKIVDHTAKQKRSYTVGENVMKTKFWKWSEYCMAWARGRKLKWCLS